MDFVPPPSVVGQNPLLLSTPVLNVMDNMKLDLIPSNQRLNNKKKNAYSKIQLPVEFFYFLLFKITFISISRYHFLEFRGTLFNVI